MAEKQRETEEPFTRVENWVLDDPRLSAGAKLLLVILIRFDNDKFGYAWPTRETQARMMGLKQARSVDGYRKELVEAGWIECEKVVFKGQSSPRYRYRILHPKLAVEHALERTFKGAVERTFEGAPERTSEGAPHRAQQRLRNKTYLTSPTTTTKEDAVEAAVEDGQKTAAKAGSDGENVTRSLTATPSLAPVDGSGFSAGDEGSGPPDSEAASTAVLRGISLAKAEAIAKAKALKVPPVTERSTP